ncbi:hypothetical protein ACFXOR_01340 [Streptomyces sp. NPDC059164]|uniref:ATP dependent DNA ligase n=1 Tax=Streptomyces sp. NPDC059164 TaxID=3346750 RepID=UPI0036920D29
MTPPRTTRCPPPQPARTAATQAVRRPSGQVPRQGPGPRAEEPTGSDGTARQADCPPEGQQETAEESEEGEEPAEPDKDQADEPLEELGGDQGAPDRRRRDGGWVPRQGQLTGLPGAVLVGERSDGLLHYAGSVGTGWSRTERTCLAELIQAVAIDTCPFAQVPPGAEARWALPRLADRVRHTSRAGRLHHPSWHRTHSDLTPDNLV